MESKGCRKYLLVAAIVVVFISVFYLLTEAITLRYTFYLVILTGACILIFVFFNRGKKDVPAILTLVGVTLAILFFTFQNLSALNDDLSVTTATTYYNCAIVSSLKKGITSSQDYVGDDRYLLNSYEMNLGYLYNKAGNHDNFDDILNAIASMDASNSLLEDIAFLDTESDPSSKPEIEYLNTYLLKDIASTTIYLNRMSNILTKQNCI